jgi:UDPglucose 6-dehydrogenase
MTDYKAIVDKSAVPVGTADKARAAVQAALLARDLADMDFAVAPSTSS